MEGSSAGLIPAFYWRKTIKTTVMSLHRLRSPIVKFQHLSQTAWQKIRQYDLTGCFSGTVKKVLLALNCYHD